MEEETWGQNFVGFLRWPHYFIMNINSILNKENKES